jgi:hypothetical protein
MYSYEDRIRAVKLYIKLGKRVASTIHQLGYPTQNALKSWHRTYELGLGLPRVYVRAKPKYSQAQQTLAIEHYLAHGRCIAATIKALGYPSRHSLRAEKECNDLSLRAARNEFAAGAMGLMHGLSRRFWFLHHRQADDTETMAELHGNLARAIATADEAAAAQALDALIDHNEAFTRSTVSTDF